MAHARARAPAKAFIILLPTVFLPSVPAQENKPKAGEAKRKQLRLKTPVGGFKGYALKLDTNALRPPVKKMQEEKPAPETDIRSSR